MSRCSAIRFGVVLLSAALCAAPSLLCGCAAGLPAAGDQSAERSYPTDERPMSSAEMIDAAVTSGMLDYSAGLLYKVYVMFAPENLPPEYRSDIPSRCGTPLIIEVQRNWDSLDPADRAEISHYIQPPGEPGDDDDLPVDLTPDQRDRDRDELN